MIILFLADGSSKIGMGHVYRSINLANDIIGFLYIGTPAKDIPIKPLKSIEHHVSYF